MRLQLRPCTVFLPLVVDVVVDDGVRNHETLFPKVHLVAIPLLALAVETTLRWLWLLVAPPPPPLQTLIPCRKSHDGALLLRLLLVVLHDCQEDRSL